MAKTKAKSSTNQKKLQDYRAYQEELLSLSQQYSQARLAVWAQEAQALHDSWSSLSQDWQSNLDQMAAVSGNQFAADGRPGTGRGRPHGSELAAKPDGHLRGRGAVGRRLPPDVGAGGGGLGERRGEPGGQSQGLVVTLGRGPGFRRLVSPGRGCGGPPGDGDFPGAP